MDEPRLRQLLDASRSLISELDPESVLRRLLEVAREVTGARYAAIGVLDERRERLERFLTVGIDERTHRQIGDLPQGRGVLGVLISDPRPLRLDDVSTHPRSYGFPLAHPPMTTFLGVPIVIEGEAWGNLYLTETDHGAFDADDEDAATILAGWAAIAITNARLYRAARERRDELERTNRGLETTTEVARALGGETDVDRVLELVVKRSRALLDARVAEIALAEDGAFVIAAIAGAGVEGLRGRRIPIEDSVAAGAMRSGAGQRFAAVPPDSFAARELGARSAIVTPMLFRDRPVGFLVVLDRMQGEKAFGDDEERLLSAFAASAATAVATAQLASDQALRRAIEASEAERRRWARELHDETLQQLAGMRVLLAGARRSGDPERVAAALDGALELLATGIDDLRALITDLRPAALDELGVQAALETLVARVAVQSGLEIEAEIALAPERWRGGDDALESTTYRLVQEGLTNVVKHADAQHIRLRVVEVDGAVEIGLHDDGDGFDPAGARSGFGLVGMRERVALARGTLAVDSAPGEGTTLRARIPIDAPPR